ncbi:MAG: alpha-amylase family glycosyl hydrolase, partial [Chloroflexota bacterium]
MQIGANYHNTNCEFIVWAPYSNYVSLALVDKKEILPMNKIANDYWTLSVKGLKPAAQYMYQLDNSKVKPDPASYFQPKGVIGPSAIVDHEGFKWRDQAWTGLDLADLLFYELHVGTFTKEGTFKAITNRVKELADFGINAIELMPMAQFSGQRGWGYDTVFPYAVHNTYGHPDDLKELVDYCHKNNVAVFIDVVYNHVGPEGNCLNDYGPYFLNGLMTRWGPTVNLDGPLNEPVRNYFLENTLYWINNYHLDGIRYDAVLFMKDKGSKHFLQELNERVNNFSKTNGRKIWLIAESGYNEPKVLKAVNEGGFGFAAQWLDDFQHAVHALLTGEKEGYYKDYGRILDLVEILSNGYVYVGMQDYHRRKSEEVYTWISPCNLITFSQNHDQVGNRLLGDRLVTLAGYEAAKVATGITILSPYIPLL